MVNKILKNIEDSILIKNDIINNKVLHEKLSKICNLLIECYEKGNKVYFCGNGGSFSDAQHLSAELNGRFYFDRPPLEVVLLGSNLSYLTAVSNDYSYEFVYSRLLEGISKPGDLLVGISTSGNSTNIVNAFKLAKDLDVKTIALTGSGGGLMKNYSDILIDVPSSDTPRIQESHILIGHIMCQLVEEILF